MTNATNLGLVTRYTAKPKRTWTDPEDGSTWEELTLGDWLYVWGGIAAAVGLFGLVVWQLVA